MLERNASSKLILICYRGGNRCGFARLNPAAVGFDVANAR